jgi:hypothetical protein
MRIHRKTNNDLKQLKEIQAARLALEAEQKAETAARRAKAWEEATLLVELAIAEGESCPSDGTFTHRDGFVFSNTQLVDSIDYADRLNTARTNYSRTRAA